MAEVAITLVPGVITESGRLGFPVGLTLPVAEIREMGGLTLTPYLYVVDSGNNRIVATDYDGNFKFSFGAFGTGNGQFNTPWGIATDGTYLYVTDTGNHRVQKFTLYGVYVSQWGAPGTADGQFNGPMGIAADSRFCYVVDNGNNRFQIFTLDGQFVYKLGEYGSGTNQFNAPTGCEDDDYFLYIDDTGNSRTVIYQKNWSLNSYGNGVLPGLTISATGARRSGFGDGILPPFNLAGGATGIEGHVGHGAGILPALTVSATGKGESHGYGAGILPALTVSAHGVGGGVGNGGGVLPALIIAAIGHEDGFGNGEGVLPALLVSATGYMTSEIAAYAGIAMNLKNKAITDYTAFPFNSFAVIAGKLYGANDTGIYLLEGADDNGVDIAAHFLSGTDDFHNDVVRRIDDFLLVWRTNGDAKLTVIEDEDDQTEYEVSDPGNKMHETRDTFAKGHTGRMMAFKFENVDGADFDIAQLHIRDRSIAKRRR